MATILVADDSPTILHIIEGLLHQDGHEVVCVTGGVALLAHLRENVPEMLLIDVMLMDSDGVEVSRLIRSKPEFDAMPIVIITSLQNQQQYASEVGADEYLTKPISGEVLIKTVDHFLFHGRNSNNAG